MRKAEPDDYYSNGIFEIARYGRHLVVNNNMSSEEHSEYMKYLKSEYSKQILSINDEIKRIRKEVLECDPIQLLSFSADNSLLGFINCFSESEINNVCIDRSTEYIQSIFVSSPQTALKRKDADCSEKFYKIVSDINNLHSAIRDFYSYFAANVIELYPDLSESTIDLIIEAQLMYMVRGDRYQIFELEYYESLLTVHNEIFIELFGISSKDIIDGIRNLQYSLTQGKLDAINSLCNLIEIFQSSNKTVEEFQNENTIQNGNAIEKCFGTKLRNVAELTGWPQSLLDELSWELNDSRLNFYDGTDFSGWPVTYLPVFRRPFIKIDNQFYCFDYYVFMDNFYRVVQKTITRLRPQYNWNNKQQLASEKMVASIFKSILPNCLTYTSNYYPIENTKKRYAENDLMILYDETLIIVEVKAGSFVYTPPIQDFDNHIRSYRSLIEKADHQCKRTKEYLRQYKIAKIFDEYHEIKSTIDMTKITKIYTICITIDNINTFAAKSEKINFLNLKDSTISIGVDDLLVYREYFDSPLTFLHFLEQRTLATQEPKLTLNDELDHLGMYIKHNCYTLELQNTKGYNRISFQGYRADLDNYFSRLYHPKLKPVKPTQVLPAIFQEIIDWLDNSNIPNRSSMANYLLNFSTEAKDELSNSISYVINSQSYSKRTISIHAAGLGNNALRYTCFVNQKDIANFTDKQKREYTLANLLRDKDDDRCLIDLYFDAQSRIENINIKTLYKKDILDIERDSVEKLSKIIAKNRCGQFYNTHKEKMKRNDLCPCGSGLKYKKCCLLTNDTKQ